MSDTIADLLPYNFASCSSTESESDDDDFTRSVSLQERLNFPYPLEKRGLNWNVSVPTQVRSSPTTPFDLANEDSWDLLYAAARQVSMMKITTTAVNDGVLGNGAPLSNRHYLPNHAIWTENQEFFRQRQFRRRFAGGYGGRCGAAGPDGLRQPAWPSLPVETQRRHQPANVFAVKPVPGGFNGGGAVSVVKKERSGTGVFLPRNYCNIPLESKKPPACSPKPQPAVLAHPLNKNMGPMIAQPQGPQYQVQPSLPPPHYNFNRDELLEVVTARRNAVMVRLGTTREARMGPPEVVLPQEWTY